MALRFLGVVFILTLLFGWALNLDSAVIVALLFWGGCSAVCIVLIGYVVRRRL